MEFGIEFYFLVAHCVIEDRGSTCKFCKFAWSTLENLIIDSGFHNKYYHEQQKSRIQSLNFNFIKIISFDYESHF